MCAKSWKFFISGRFLHRICTSRYKKMYIKANQDQILGNVLEYSYFRILLIAIFFSLEEVMNGVCCFLNLYQSLQGIASVATKGQHYPAQHLPHTFKTLFYLIHNCLFKEQCQMVCCSTETSSVPVYWGSGWRWASQWVYSLYSPCTRQGVVNTDPPAHTRPTREIVSCR